MNARSRTGLLPAAAVALAVALPGTPSMPAARAAEPPGSAAPAAPLHAEAATYLAGMARYLASLPGLQVRLIASYDVVQNDGQKIEFNELREMSLARPGRLRMRHVSSDGAEDLLVFDGKTISVLDGKERVYAQAPQPAALDDAIVYFVRDLGMRLPLARLFTTRAADEFMGRLHELEYVERTGVLPVPAHHVAARANGVDVQMWIADGARPLPLRIVLTYVEEPGQPQYRAQFLDWKTEAPAGADAFRFTPPEGARRIVFAAQAKRPAGDAASGNDAGARP